MKKFIAIVLTVVMVLSLVACASNGNNSANNGAANNGSVNNGAANNNNNNNAGNNGAANDNVADDNAADNDAAVDGPATMPEDNGAVDGPATMPEDNGAIDGPAAMPEDDAVDGPAAMPEEDVTDDPVEDDAPSAPSGDTLGKTLMGYFTSLVNGGETSLENLANSIVTHESILFMGGAMPVEPGWLAGFDSEISGFSEGWFFGPMIGTIPFAGYVFTVDGDANAFADTLKANANLRWNICTAADEINIKVIGNTVFCLLSPYTIEG